MYFRLWGVTFMSNCEVTLRHTGVSLVWALNVCLVFLFVFVARLAFMFFLSPCSWRRRRIPGFISPRSVGAWVRQTITYYFCIAI